MRGDVAAAAATWTIQGCRASAWAGGGEGRSRRRRRRREDVRCVPQVAAAEEEGKAEQIRRPRLVLRHWAFRCPAMIASPLNGPPKWASDFVGYVGCNFVGPSHLWASMVSYCRHVIRGERCSLAVAVASAAALPFLPPFSTIPSPVR